MKVLQIHNKYVYPGGEDAVASSEAAMLRSFGHEVIEYQRSNTALSMFSLRRKLGFYLQEIYFSRRIYNEVRALIASEKPDVAHFHNSFFMITPAAYEACFDEGIPVVQTLHNYRFLCTAATFFRSGRVCEECLSNGRIRGIMHGCWHGSCPATWLMTRVIREYERRGILKRISKFIALSEFSRQKFIQAGWDAARIVVKPNFLDGDPGPREGTGKHVLYVGALQPYKGVGTLLKAWASGGWPVPLKIVGSGPLEKELRSRMVSRVDCLGQKTPDEVWELMKEAVCVVLPSECYENFPRVIIEAYACSVPVVASRLGALAELVEDGRTGLLFDPGNAQSLAGAVRGIVSNPAMAQHIARTARQVFEKRYTPQANHGQQIEIYRQAVSGR